ncbi:hypothetical protein J2741_001883 [Methanolinea mesophila]|uniref:hypothetical protein n=1 Tax=Methanolinea mesophila TaxID=547055 RepID=UPI001AEA10C9|nr:hypothetical protein [Methanolinea mesophila]MBP1929336.1 hypothetical protein [Methanolinea mesophila]
MKKLTIMVIALAMLVAFTGMAMADTGVNQVPETQGIVTATNIEALGTVTETDTIVWSLAYLDLTVPPLGDDEIYYVMSYTEDTIADQGLVSYVKGQSLDTANMVAGTYNFETGKVVEFIGLDTGRMLSSENMVLDGAAEGKDVATGFICPFAVGVTEEMPPFCNIIEVGSDVDVTLASLTTAADERHVMKSSDPAVEVDYAIKMTGFGDVPAMGSADAYINAHIQEARTDDGAKAEDLTYSEMSTAAGDITLFQKVIAYQSGLRRF